MERRAAARDCPTVNERHETLYEANETYSESSFGTDNPHGFKFSCLLGSTSEGRPLAVNKRVEQMIIHIISLSINPAASLAVPQ